MPEPELFNYTLKDGTEIQTKIKIPEEYLGMVEDIRNVVSDECNPNTMTPTQHTGLWNSLTTFGWTYPILTNKDGVLADGEQRHTVCMNKDEFYAPVLRLPLEDIDRRMLCQVSNKLKGNHALVADLAEFRIILQGQRLDDLASIITLDEEALRKQLANRTEPVDSLFKLANPQYIEKPEGITGLATPPEMAGANLDVAAKHTLTFVFENLEKRNQVRDTFLEGKKNHIPSGEELWEKLNP